MSVIPKISVVVPVYNREKFIVRAINSILEQSFSNFEVIVVDDGSKDKSVEIVQEIAGHDLRVRCIPLSRNAGAQAARNVGIRAAQSEWIAFLDSDDEWLPDSLDKRFNRALERNVKVVHSDALRSTGDGEHSRWGLRPLEGYCYAALLKKPGPMFQGLLVAKDALEKIGYLDESIISYQEWDTFIRLAEHYDFAFVHEPTYVWHFDHGGSMSDNKLNNARGLEQVFKKNRRAIFRHAGIKITLGHYYVIFRSYLAQGYIKRAFLCWL